jgi:hypothetical protein
MEEVVEDKGYIIDAFDGADFEGHPGEIISPRNDASLLARDVVDFGVILYEIDDAGQSRVLFPKQGGPTEYRVPADGIPTSADIFVRILDEEGAKQINAFERGLIPNDDPDFWWDTVIKFSTVYSKRVYFKAQPL